MFQGAATVDSILRDDLVEEAAAAGLRSLFVDFDTLSSRAASRPGRTSARISAGAIEKSLASSMISGS